LRSDDFSTLNDDEDFDNFTVEYCITLMIKETYLDCSLIVNTRVHKIFHNQNQPYEASFLEVFNFEHRFMIMPLADGVHWDLVILDTEKAIFFYFNSLTPNTRLLNQAQAKLQKFLTFVLQFNNPANKNKKKLPIPKRWKVKTFKYNRQSKKDHSNCGIYVLNYIQQFLKSQCVEKLKEFNPKTNRLYWKKLILATSDNLSNACLKCAIENENTYITCIKCIRKVHTSCLWKKQCPKDPANYTCPLCD
jgi:Ulp1 protease family, C-terminal catalytic domain